MTVRRNTFAILFIAAVFSFGVIATNNAPVLGQEAPAQNGGDGVQDESQEPQKKNPFTHFIESAGPVFGIVFLVGSILLVTIIVLAFMDLRLGNAIPPNFVDDFTDLVNKRQFKQAYELCREDSSFLARVMTSGMSRLQYGIDDARESAINQAEAVKSGKEQIINYLGTIGTIAPLVGLFGTVWGMIQAFRELAGGGTPKPAELAGDISQALVTTFLGILVALPAIFFHAFFRGRLNRMTNETSNLADDLLTQLYHNTRKSSGQPDTRTTAAT